MAQLSLKPPRPKKNLTSSNPRPKDQNENLSNQALLHGKGNTASNPIDVDAVYSLFEPAIVKEYVHISLSLTSHSLTNVLSIQVEKEEISFRREEAPTKVESTFDLHAFDTDGTQIPFKVKAHVSS